MSSASNGPRRWIARTSEDPAAARLAQRLGCPQSIAALLLARGISTAEAAESFFHPTINELHDPLQMLGMDTAVRRIQQAIGASEPILIYGDYDVDGTTATVLLKTAIERIAPKRTPARVAWHIPHRLREGYGMQTNILADAAASGIRLVISVDTGIRAFAAAAEARALGLDLIVTDHHLPDDAEGIPDAVAVLNPAQPGCPYPFKHLCGAAVAFKLAHAILLAHADSAASEVEREAQRLRLRKVLLPSFLKLVAIATIADSVPLEGENRIIASLGLAELRNPVQPGLRALMQVAQVPMDRPPTATEVGFRIAPRINAAGRMDIAGDVVELFLTRDSARATELAEKLDRLNNERRETEAHALAAIEQQLETLRDDSGEFLGQCIVLDDPEWHRGVLGILASRVVDRTGRPALVLMHEDGQAHGSGRSIEGFHLLDALTAIQQGEGGEVFSRFGGHAHAVGFSLPSAHLPLLRSRMQQYSEPLLSGPMLAPPIAYDVAVAFADLGQKLCDWLSRCGPFGVGNPEPILMICGLVLAAPVRIIKERHVCLELRRDVSDKPVSALGWSRASVDWPARCAELGLDRGSVVDVLGRLRVKSNPQYPGLELELIDLRLSLSRDLH